MAWELIDDIELRNFRLLKEGTPVFSDAVEEVQIDSMSDFPAPSSGVITLDEADKIYTINAALSTADRFVIDADNIVIRVANPLVHGITYTSSETLFTSTDHTFGILGLNLTAATGTLFSFTNNARTKNVTILSCKLDNVDTIGTIVGYNTQTYEFNAATDCGDGLTMSLCNQGVYLANKNYGWKQQSNAIMLTVDGATTGIFKMSANLFHPETNETALDWTVAARFDSYAATGNTFVGVVDGGTYLGSDVDIYDLAVEFQGNTGIPETAALGFFFLRDNNTNTIISTVNTYVDVAGTFQESTKNERWTLVNGNEFQYNGKRPLKGKIIIDGNSRRQGGSGNDDHVYAIFYDDGQGGGFVELTDGRGKVQTNTQEKGFSFSLPVDVVENGKFKIRVKNETDTDDLECRDVTILIE